MYIRLMMMATYLFIERKNTDENIRQTTERFDVVLLSNLLESKVSGRRRQTGLEHQKKCSGQ